MTAAIRTSHLDLGVEPFRMRWFLSTLLTDSGGIHAKNGFTSRYEIPWAALLDISFAKYEFNAAGKPISYRLEFKVVAEPRVRKTEKAHTSRHRRADSGRTRWISAHATKVRTGDPGVSGRRGTKGGVNLQEIRTAILSDRDAVLADGSIQRDAARASGLASVLWNHPNTRANLDLALVVLCVVMVGVAGLVVTTSVLIISVVNNLAGSWLTGHVGFWDELVGAARELEGYLPN